MREKLLGNLHCGNGYLEMFSPGCDFAVKINIRCDTRWGKKKQNYLMYKL